MSITALPVTFNGFNRDGIYRDETGMAHYRDLPPSLVHMLRDRVAEHPDREAVVEVGGRRLSYSELWDEAARVAGGLRSLGVAEGDRVAIMCPAGTDWVIALWGSFLAGAIAVPVNTRFAAPEVEYVLHDSGSKYVFEPNQPLPQGDPTFVEPSLTDVAAIFYTSGTTGHPKGALTTHEAFLTNCENMGRGVEGRYDGLRTLISVPLFHVTGCNSQLLAATYDHGTSIILPALDIAMMIRSMVEEQVNYMVTVPALYAMMLAHPHFAAADVSHVARVGYGGAPIAPALVHALKAKFPNARVSNGFGLTESAALAVSLPDEFAATHADAIGFPVPVDDVALADVDPASGVGELLLRGPNITIGYWNKPELTEDAFVDGWFRTGDMARVADDGMVWIVDRAKDMINRGGENVYSVEVENALAGAPGVFEAAVIAVPNEKLGEAVGAVIVPPPGTAVDPMAIVSYLDDKIADFKIPQYFSVRSEPLPRNPGGKILKTTLRSTTQWGPRVR